MFGIGIPELLIIIVILGIPIGIILLTKKSDSELDDVTIASQNQRLGNYLLDLIFVYIAVFIVGLVLGLIGLGGLNNTLFGIVIFFIYYISQEGYSGKTLGKLITGTKAVKEDGTEMSIGQVLGRTLCRLIPFEPFSFFGGNGRPRGWHDRISKTKVISVKKENNPQL